MEVFYCNVDKITSILNSLKLNNCSIKEVFEFMCNEDGDTEKYIIKMNLLPLLENYLHIDILKFNFAFLGGKEINDGDEAFEIINRQKNKPFWETMLDNSCFIKSTDRYYMAISNFMSWISLYFDEYYYYNFGPFNRKYINIPDNEHDRAEDKREIEEKLKKILDCLGITIEEFNKVITYIVVKVKNKYNLTESDEKFICYVKMLLEDFIQNEKYIKKLGRDLIFNLMMLKSICNNILFEENDLSNILKKIRGYFYENAKSSGYGSKFDDELDEYVDVYRNFDIDYEGQFWNNTSTFKDIPRDMDEFFSDFSNIHEIEDDTEYAFKCFELCQRFLQIHPYRNGNGRTSKYLLFLLLMRRSILPVTITDNHDLTSCYKENFDSLDLFRGRMMMAVRRAGIR